MAQNLMRTAHAQAELVQGNLGTCIRADGVQGGDLLWVISNPETGDMQAPATSGLLRPTSAGSAMQDQQEKHSEQLDSAPSEIRPAASQGMQSLEERVATGSEDTEMEASPSNDQEREAHSLSLSDIFQLVRQTNGAEMNVLQCALHAVLLDAGLHPTWINQVWLLYIT